jgi:hypothetical protein
MFVTRKFAAAEEYWNNMSVPDRNEIFQKIKDKDKQKGLVGQRRNILIYIQKHLLK